MQGNRAYLTTAQAQERSGLTQAYLSYLLRKHQIEGFRLAREWFIYMDSLDAFLATPRKPGPKGPRKGSSQNRLTTG